MQTRTVARFVQPSIARPRSARAARGRVLRQFREKPLVRRGAGRHRGGMVTAVATLSISTRRYSTAGGELVGQGHGPLQTRRRGKMTA